MEAITRFLAGAKTVAVRCLQWGDTGKGKIVDLLTPWADIIARGGGGDNAGHTIKYNGKELISHLIPSGITGDADGKITVIGSGTAVYPLSLKRELHNLVKHNLSFNNLMLALNAKLILPDQILQDRIKESNKGITIGTTGKGMGPVYTDHVARTGLIVNDVLNKDIFVKKLKHHLDAKRNMFRQYDFTLIEKIMQDQHLSEGIFFDAKNIFNFDAIVDYYYQFGQEFGNLITDTDTFMQTSVGKLNILLEGAQGMLLSIDYGTYPFVTSSDPSLAGLAKGVGLSEADVDIDLGIIKGLMETRVGNGPFPTEFGGEESALFCAENTRQSEKEKYPEPSINDPQDLIKGIALRQQAGEYGATTGRPRRTGYLDLPLLRWALRGTNAKTKLVMTKLDVLSGCEEIKVCTSYRFNCNPNSTYRYGAKRLTNGDLILQAMPQAEFLAMCEPQFRSFPGWNQDIRDVKDYFELPTELKHILNVVAHDIFPPEMHKGGMFPVIISVGPSREETIFLS